jgi:AraC family ethanolamine operon transcriptional activator
MPLENESVRLDTPLDSAPEPNPIWSTLGAMPISQSLPTRRVSLDTDNPDELTKIQPERPRSFVQLQRGALSFKMRELAWGHAGIQSERWTCGIRMQVSRPSSYVTFGLITQARARFMGAPIGPGSVLRIVGPWECVSEGAFEYMAFAVSRSTFEAAALLARDPGEYEMPSENRVGRRTDAMALAMRLLQDLHALQDRVPHPAALAAEEDELLRLALLLDRPPDLIPVERLSSSPGRRGAIRRVDAYLEANSDAVPSIPTLCQVAEVSERTLEYAFREHLGVTPVRYLKLRRLMLARRRLQNPMRAESSVTDIVGGCGVYELGRFAGEYRKLFGELPSETLARSCGTAASAASDTPAPQRTSNTLRRRTGP